ncbi:SGNH/GDSL hydrolase family protein [Helicobacter sp.]|uniref:SGNH/GDSL hydrolase family protein n=1 Tax=Helicobacter sp. TaxID=218 RepID=UPI0025BD7811|nr:SGNH/GDSL hydrolase family protein [Helicobacter sp.]MCI5967944.1 SGNH/GDSL hydrolase family protein [Helicobacter sp.]
MDVEEMITEYMKNFIDDKEYYIVINFGVSGYTLYDQMLLYNALVYPLQPEIVISFLGTDWYNGFFGCEHLIKTHKMVYSTGLYEIAYKEFCDSDVPLYIEQSTNPQSYNKNISIDDVNTAIITRMQQFDKSVCSNNGKFFAFVQPMLPCMLHWTKEECAMRDKERERFNKTSASMNIFVDNYILNCVKDFKEKAKVLEYCFDLNEIIEKSNRESFFTNHWIHCNAKGNKIIAEKVIEILRQKGAIG